ncbi:MAG TPA: LptF/LptG family permease [bacterium]|nr:LptF/LptG family permease [bacterium]
MFIVSRYVIREHIGPFFFALALITSMLLLNFVLQAMRYIIGKGISMTVILEFIAYNLAGIIVLVVPMSILVATIMAFGRLASDNEVTALKAGGINFFKLIFPVILVACIVTYGVFWFNDEVLPLANHNARVLKKNIQAKRPTLSIEPGVFLEGIENFSMIVENKDELGSTIYGVTIFDKSDRNAQRTITAKRGSIAIEESNDNMILELEEGEIHEYHQGKNDQYQRIIFQKYKVIVAVENLSLKTSDESFRNDREKNIDQLMEEVARHRKERERQMGLVLKNIEKKPESVTQLDPRARKLVEKYCVEFSWLDAINDYFMDWNLRLALDTAYVPYTDYVLSDSLKQTIQTYLKDTLKHTVPVAESQPSALRSLDPSLGRRPNMSKSAIPVDSVEMPLTAISNQVSGNISTVSSYQRLMDQSMVEVNKKYSIPMACLIFVLLGAPIGVKAKRGNLGLAAGISLFFFIAYYFCLILGEDLADRGLMNPFFAMWFMNFFLGMLGCVLIYQTVTEKTMGWLTIRSFFHSLKLTMKSSFKRKINEN